MRKDSYKCIFSSISVIRWKNFEYLYWIKESKYYLWLIFLNEIMNYYTYRVYKRCKILHQSQRNRIKIESTSVVWRNNCTATYENYKDYKCSNVVVPYEAKKWSGRTVSFVLRNDKETSTNILPEYINRNSIFLEHGCDKIFLRYGSHNQQSYVEKQK